MTSYIWLQVQNEGIEWRKCLESLGATKNVKWWNAQTKCQGWLPQSDPQDYKDANDEKQQQW